MASIQAPSATQTFLASPEDAIILMEAARQGLIPRTTRRLTRTERADLIDDGAVFIFEEQETQMQRWTDGRRWSCSRVMGEFLAYDEVVPCGGPAGRSSGAQTCRLENGLIKQSFALTLSADTAIPKKYHIISYSRSLTMHQWKRPSQQPQFAALDLSLWHSYPPLSAAGSSSSGAASSSSRTAGLRTRTAAPRTASTTRPKESVSFMFNPDALAAAPSAAPSRGGSSTPVASTSTSGACCPPKVEPSPRSRPTQRTRSTSPASVPPPSQPQYAYDAAHGPSSGSRQRSVGFDRPSSSAAAAVSLLGLGANVKMEPLPSSSVPSLAAPNGLQRSRPPSPHRRSRSPTYGHPYASQQASPARPMPSQAYQQPMVAYPTFASNAGSGGSPSLFLPHPYEARLSSELSGPTFGPPPTGRPPWAPSTLGQEDRKMLGRLPFRI